MPESATTGIITGAVTAAAITRPIAATTEPNSWGTDIANCSDESALFFARRNSSWNSARSNASASL
ncbi:hypothetical protein [Microlunatus parietis]|uniref:Uncharacterized protein n=1 Tax=Microlunatus parietis TaxID=682979 RepID=A0A7Y9LDP4_9ACTN|nr:hypothetical protein [Microlunatus parietis]NYE72166.1 hypothetical protein [Microlunatus parietis]